MSRSSRAPASRSRSSEPARVRAVVIGVRSRANSPRRRSSTPPACAEMRGVREDEKLSDELGRWLGGSGEHTLHGLIEVFQEKSFAVLFVLLLGVPALPLPTGG